MTALALQDQISQSSTHTKAYNTLSVQYGDGYIQRAPDGINQEREMWNLLYENLTLSQYQTMQVFLETVKQSGVIEWTPIDDYTGGSPQQPEKKFIIDPETDISITNKTGQIYNVSFTLKRVYDL